MTNGLTDEAVAAYAAQLLDLEADIETLQGDKKDTYANVRETYGKKVADALKLAIKRHRMDSEKRDAAEELDAEAERMGAIIARAPRAMRTREIIEEFDQETGEVSSTAALKEVRDNSTGNGPRKPSPEPVAAITLPAGTQAPPVETIPGNDAEAAENEVEVALVASSSAQPSEPALAPSEIAEPGDRGAASLAATVVAFRTHNPETHFLNSKGLVRLHGCLNAEVCASSQPRAKLCFDCSLKHDGPSHSGEVA